MDGFQILRCLWKRLDKMRQSIILEFSKTASLVAKNGTKKLFKFCNFYCIWLYLEAQIDYSPFILFMEWCLKIMHNIFQIN